MNKFVIAVGISALLSPYLTAQSGSLAQKKAGDVLKNVQVLKDVPIGAWNDTMWSMSVALGVNCGHCHKGAYDNEDAPVKQAARRMIQMTNDINQKNFGGSTVVICYTCHQGNVHPKIIASLWTKPPAPPAATAAPKGDAESLPDAEQVFARYRAAVGEKEVQSLRMVGSVTSSNSSAALVDFEVMIQFPDKLAQKRTISGTQVRQIITGERVFVVAPGRIIDVSPSDAVASARGFTTYHPVKFADPEAPRKTTGFETIGNKKYVILESRSPRLLERLYFDTQTGLLYKRYTETQTAFGATPNEVVFEDYRDVNGVKLPFHFATTSPEDHNQIECKELQINIPVDPALFARPTEPPPAK